MSDADDSLADNGVSGGCKGELKWNTRTDRLTDLGLSKNVPPAAIHRLEVELMEVGWVFQMDVYLRVRRAVMVEEMSIREASRVSGLHRDTVRKMLAYSVPPGYRRQTSPRRPNP